jgi:hypothetical protein
MEDYYFEKDIDNQLYEAIQSENVYGIKNLLKNGANINAIDKYDDNMIIKYISEKQSKTSMEILKCIVEAGINTNYEVEGFNCLFNAYLANRVDVVEYLLKIGTSAQCISTDSCETLLDWIEWDKDFEEEDARTTMEWIEESNKIIQLLKDYGATNVEKCITTKVEEYLKMFGGDNTGLFTKNGYINIENVQNVNKDLINTFYQWKKLEYPFIDKTWNKEDIDIEALIECNNMGLMIIKTIKKLLPVNIKVQFNYIIAEDYKKSKVRNIKELII